MIHHDPYTFLREQANIPAFWDYPSDKFVIDFAGALLIWGGGVTVKQTRTAGAVLCKFQSAGVRELTAVIG